MREVERRAAEAYRDRFDEQPEVVASSPGRVNLIGEHTDYNGGFVLPFAIDLRVAAAIGHGTAGLYSLDFDNTSSASGCREGSWADYPRGVAWALAEAGYQLPQFQAAVTGDVPRGSGLSSSAAIEGATGLGLDALGRLEISRRDLAVVCQRAENGYLGVNSGIMDQYASLLCKRDMALLIDCRSLESRDVPLELDRNGLAVVVCDTRVERTLERTAYNERRIACERAAEILGVPSLRDATLEDLHRLSGEELRRARHVVTENIRVLDAVDALQRGDFDTVGRLMYASHASLRDDYEVSVPELNAFVEVAQDCGALGARLTGAGFGGCALALIKAENVEALTGAAEERFRREGFTTPRFYRFEPSEGADLAQG